jgi:hypothetical protein
MGLRGRRSAAEQFPSIHDTGATARGGTGHDVTHPLIPLNRIPASFWMPVPDPLTSASVSTVPAEGESAFFCEICEIRVRSLQNVPAEGLVSLPGQARFLDSGPSGLRSE